MLSYVALAISGLCVAYAVHTYRCFNANLAAAKQSGIPYISTFDPDMLNHHTTTTVAKHQPCGHVTLPHAIADLGTPQACPYTHSTGLG